MDAPIGIKSRYSHWILTGSIDDFDLTMDKKQRAILIGVSAATFLGPLTQTIYTPSLPEIGTFFGVDIILVNLTISIYTIILAAGNFIFGPVADIHGRRMTLLPGLLLFIVGSVICFFSDSYLLFLTGRTLQALGISTSLVVAAAVIGDIFEPKDRGQAMSTYQTLIYLGPVIGPVLGSLISAYAHWQWAFAVVAIAGIVTFIYNKAVLNETLVRGISPNKITPKTFKKILANRAAFAIILLGFSQFYGYYMFLVFLPMLLTLLFKVSMVSKGLFFVPLTAGVMLGTFFGGRLQMRWGRKRIVVTTSYGLGVTVLLFSLLLVSGLLSVVLFISLISVYGMLLGCSLPAQTTAIVNLFKHEKATAVGVYNFIRFTGASAGPIAGEAIRNMAGDKVLFFSLGVMLMIAALTIHRYFHDPHDSLAHYGNLI